MVCPACSGCGLVWRTEPQAHAVPCEACGGKGRVPAVARADFERERDARVAAEAEAARLTTCLRRANATLEETERALYLEAQAAEAARDRLRAASQALAGIDAATLDAVTPAAMRAVMERRGWRLDCALPWYADQTQTAWESWEHATAQGAGSRGGGPRTVPDVQIAVLPGLVAKDHRRGVAEWAWALATRHGDVSPAEVLAEALAEGVAK